MPKKKQSFFDDVADKLKKRADSISEGQVGASRFCEISDSVDVSVVGDYPQADPPRPQQAFLDDGGLYFDRFPKAYSDPIVLRLKASAKWTDVLSASVQYRCFLVNNKALSIFEKFELGNVKRYAAIVRGKSKVENDYTYLFVGNHIKRSDIDFRRSSFFLVDIISDPISPIQVEDEADYQKKIELAKLGELPGCDGFSKIKLGTVCLLPGHVPQGAIFGMGAMDTKIYATTELRDALLDAGITGLDFAENTRLMC